jgi:organic hydroperoxide reductase OsmC/OhrA
MNTLFQIELNWKRETSDFSYDHFNRNHTIQYGGGQILNNSAAMDYFGNAEMANPEELLASALASCHMLTFLAVASKSGYNVTSYQDHASAILDKNEDGKMAVSIINLKPLIKFEGPKLPDDAQLKSLHDKAHRNCFIANSIKTKINIL